MNLLLLSSLACICCHVTTCSYAATRSTLEFWSGLGGICLLNSQAARQTCQQSNDMHLRVTQHSLLR